MTVARVQPPVNGAPAHRDPAWRHLVLRRAVGDKPRRPLYRLPGNLTDGTPTEKVKVKQARDYWEGYEASWDSLLEGVQVHGYDIGLCPDPNGLVVLDCDVKQYDPETGWVAQPDGSLKLAPFVEKRGIDDLARVVAELGHDPAELATYTVRTKSGGHHLYYRKNPHYPLRWTGHRHEWRVDVIAENGGSNRSWIAAPPTPGYRVVRDLPVAKLPDWLGAWLVDLHSNTEPLGGARRRQLSAAASAVRAGLTASGARLSGAAAPGGDLAALYAHYYDLVLKGVALANRYGGWNCEIYNAAHLLFETGVPLDEATPDLLRAAAPWNEREERVAVTTIESAWGKHRRGARRDGDGGTAR